MTSLISIRSQLSAFEPTGQYQGDIKALLSVYIDAEEQLPSEELISNLRDDLPPEVLYYREVLAGPNILFRLLRNYLTLNGFQYRQHRENNRISYGLPATLYDSEADREMALNILRTITVSVGDVNSDNKPTLSYTPSENSEPSKRIAHNMAIRFKSYKKFTRKLGEDLTDHINNDLDAAKDYGLNAQQKVDYFHHIFDGEAKRFFREKIGDNGLTFGVACLMMQDEFNSITRQNCVRKHLQTIRLNTVTKENKCGTSEALEEIRERITKLTPQGPMTHRNDTDKVEYLYKAIVGAEWAKLALSSSQSSSPPWNFQQLYAALDAAWSQEQEELEARQRDGITSKQQMSLTTALPGLQYYQGQGM